MEKFVKKKSKEKKTNNNNPMIKNEEEKEQKKTKEEAEEQDFGGDLKDVLVPPDAHLQDTVLTLQSFLSAESQPPVTIC